MEFIITNSGNDVVDSLTGLQNHILNLSRMISGPQFQEFIKHKNSDVVIMVSTGPSLTKQLPLLRSIQDHVTIICADSALRVLYLNGITADICTSMERDDLIYKLFEDIPYEYRKKIIFLRASLQNPSMFSITDGCTDILVMRPFGYNRSFKLDQYGYVCGGMSVANMSHELIALMNFKACIIIGQDLAYGADGSTHSKGYTFGETFNAVYEETGQKIISLPAYGGTGTVNSNMVWEMFLNGLRHSVAVSKDTFPTINATEGGAHIEGTLELSFLDAIEQYVDKTFKKTPIKAIYTIPEEIKRLTLEAYTTLDSIITEGESLQQLIEATFISIAEPCKKLENKTIDQQLKEFSDSDIIRMLDGIEKMRDTLMKNNTYNAFYWDLIQPIAIHHEIGLATIKTMPVSNPEENKHKAILWIFNHIPYFYTLAGSINNIVHIIRENKEKSMKN